MIPHPFKRLPHSLKAILLLLFLAPCVASAQQLRSKQQNDISINWKNAAEARNILNDRVENIHQQMLMMVPGSPNHTIALRRVAYYKEILRTLDENVPLADAMEAALPYAATLGGTRELNFTSGNELRDLYIETRSFLSN